MDSKEHEIRCLKETIDACSGTQGETRRILKRLSLEYCDFDNERPDFVFEIPSNKHNETSIVIGLEHFTVDQCCEPQRKRDGINSLGAKQRRRIEKLYATYTPYIQESGELPDKAVKEFFQIAEGAISDCIGTSYPELMASFEKNFCNHLNKVSKYRENLRLRASIGKRIEIGFLIEIHSDMSCCMLASNKKRHMCEPGDILVTTEMLDIINKARGKVDFVILSSYGNVDAKPRKIVAFKCGNPEKSITKQSIPICVYTGIDAGFNPFVVPKPKVSVTPRSSDYGDSVNSEITVNRSGLPKEIRTELMLFRCMQAWCALRNGQTILANTSVMKVLDEFGDAIVGWRSLTDNEGKWRVRPILCSPHSQRAG